MRPSPGKINQSESFTFRSGGDFVRIEVNGGVVRAAERPSNDTEYAYLAGAPQQVRFEEFLQLVIDGFRHVQTTKDTVAYVFRVGNKWVRVEENNNTIEFSERADEDEEYVYLTGPAEALRKQQFIGVAAKGLNINTLGFSK